MARVRDTPRQLREAAEADMHIKAMTCADFLIRGDLAAAMAAALMYSRAKYRFFKRKACS